MTERYGLYRENTETEERKQLLRRQKHQISMVGGACAAFWGVTMAVQIGLIMFLSVLRGFYGGGGSIIGMEAATLLSSISMYGVAYPVTAAMMLLIPRCGRPERGRLSLKEFGLCMVAAVGVGFAGNMIGSLAEFIKPGGTDTQIVEEMLQNSSLWSVMATTVFLAPVTEEYLYRKMIIDRLAGFGQGPAIFISAFMFGLAHGNFSQFFYAFGLGLMFGYVYAKTGRIGYTIAFHMIFNMLGGAIPLELSRFSEGIIEGHFFLTWFQEASGLDLTLFLRPAASLLILMYFFFQIAAFAGSILLLISYRKKIQLAPGQWPIKKGEYFKTICLNPGMIIYLLICGGMFLLNW